MVSKPNSKQTCKIENRVKTKQREKNNNKKSKAYLASPAQPTSRPSSPPWPAQPASALPVVFLLGTVGQRRVAGARAHAPEPPPACRPAPDRLRMPRHPPGTPSSAPLPPCSLPLTPLLFSPHGRSRHGHSAEKHRGQPLPRSLSVFPRSVSPPASSSPNQASPEALQCRRHHLLLPRAPKAVIVDSSPSSLPRAR